MYTEFFCKYGQLRFYGLARYAFLQALQLAGVKQGSRVLLPEFLCKDLLASLHRVGALPCWYAVNYDLSPSAPSSEWPDADVVLMVDYFGFPQGMAPFLEYRSRTGALIIEDNAHGYLSKDEMGEWLGCRTELGIFSIRKTLRIPDGAALWIRNSLELDILPNQSELDGSGFSPSELVKARLRKMPIFGEMLYRSLGACVRLLRKLQTGCETPIDDPKSEYELPPYKNPWAGLLTAINNCQVSLEIDRRRLAYKKCAMEGALIGAQPVFNTLPENCAPYAYAFRGEKKVVNAMKRYAVEQGFVFMRWPNLPQEINNKLPHIYNNVFLVNFIW